MLAKAFCQKSLPNGSAHSLALHCTCITANAGGALSSPSPGPSPHPSASQLPRLWKAHRECPKPACNQCSKGGHLRTKRTFLRILNHIFKGAVLLHKAQRPPLSRGIGPRSWTKYSCCQLLKELPSTSFEPCTNLGKRPDRWLRGKGHRVGGWGAFLPSYLSTPPPWNDHVTLKAEGGGVMVWIGLKTPRNPSSAH